MEKAAVKLRVGNVSKSFFSKKGEEQKVIKNISFDVYENEFLVILGPGLCGKSVLLNIMMGLLPMDSGKILLNGRENALKNNKSFSMVFQKIGLMPWKTVMQNVEFGPQIRGENSKTRQKTAQHYIDMVGLNGFEKSYPLQLSGGMKQRVGIARAYTTNPEVLIMDEPFGQLDAQTRYQMQNELLRIRRQETRTVIFVTNNIEEACFLGDRIILLSNSPSEVKGIYPIELKHPRNPVDPMFLKIRKIISDNMDLAL